MRKLIIISAIVFLSKISFSQDVITLKNGDKLRVKVLQVDKERVTYTKPEEAEGRIYTVDIADVIIIIFEKDNQKYKKNNPSVESGGSN